MKEMELAYSDETGSKLEAVKEYKLEGGVLTVTLENGKTVQRKGTFYANKGGNIVVMRDYFWGNTTLRNKGA